MNLNDKYKYLYEKQVCELCGKEFYYTKKQIKTRIKRLDACENIFIGCSKNCTMTLLNKSKEHKDKVRNTCLKKYGVDNYAKTIECNKKIKNTKLRKFGSENYNNLEKAKQTCLNKYNATHYSKTHDFKNLLSSNMKKN